MSVFKKILAGTAGIAALAGIASPAAAQYYPNYGYGQNGYGQNGYGNNVGGAISQAINGVISATQYGGYPNGNYGYGQNYGNGLNSNVAVSTCAHAAESRMGYGTSRVTGIRNIEPRNNGALRVNGYLSSYSGYGYGQPNLTFSCKIDRFARVIDLRIDQPQYGEGYGRGYDNSNGYGRGW